jgi:RimJ/RimL family protein N-acetyltransferase
MPAFDQLLLETERLTLRPLQESDIPALFRIFSNPEVMRYWSTPPWPSDDEARKLVERDQKAMLAGDFLRLGMVLKANNELIGKCTLFSFVEQSKRCEIGYGMAHEHWGKGLMHEALCALVEYGINTLHLHRIEADIDPRNLGSARSLERLGFVKEGHLRERWIVDGVVSDTGLYGLLASDWNNKKPAA